MRIRQALCASFLSAAAIFLPTASRAHILYVESCTAASAEQPGTLRLVTDVELRLTDIKANFIRRGTKPVELNVAFTGTQNTTRSKEIMLSFKPFEIGGEKISSIPAGDDQLNRIQILYGTDIAVEQGQTFKYFFPIDPCGKNSPPEPRHGGQMYMGRERHYEVVTSSGGMRFYLTDHQNNPIAAKGMKATLAIDSNKEILLKNDGVGFFFDKPFSLDANTLVTLTVTDLCGNDEVVGMRPKDTTYTGKELVICTNRPSHGSCAGSPLVLSQ